MKRIYKIGLVTLILTGIGFGTWIGFTFNAINKIEYEVKEIKLEKVNLSTSLLTPKLDIEMKIIMETRTEARYKFSIENFEYSIAIDNNNFGSGVSEPFTNSKKPSNLTLHHSVESVSLTKIKIIYELYYEEKEKEVEIIVTKAKVHGLPIKLNKKYNMTISKSDLPELNSDLWEEYF